jgi:D-3-phosphoglycerate dehydrogenase
LREINNVFSSRGINIAAEYLQTDTEIGYVIIETESELDSSVINELKQIPYTIRTRIIY